LSFYIAIINYEMGNLKSIYKCIKHLNADAIITDDIKEIMNADGVILPGVGAFGDAMKNLKEKNLIPVLNQIVKDKKPLFGICLGQQLIFSRSYEMGKHEGLNLVKGEVIPFDISKVEKVPQIGWNSVEFSKSNNFLIQGIPNNSYFYFVHSFYTNPEDKDLIVGITKYGAIEYCSIINKDNIIATQFHPEKSSKHGIQIYDNFIKYCRK